MDWQQTSHNPALTRVFWNLIRQPGSVSEAEFADVSAKVERAMDILEEALSSSPWLGGESFTMAECALAPGVHRYLHLPMERKPRPHLARWYAAVLRRPVAQQILLLPLT
jgi:glutathione S-transferase